MFFVFYRMLYVHTHTRYSSSSSKKCIYISCIYTYYVRKKKRKTMHALNNNENICLSGRHVEITFFFCSIIYTKISGCNFKFFWQQPLYTYKSKRGTQYLLLIESVWAQKKNSAWMVNNDINNNKSTCIS